MPNIRLQSSDQQICEVDVEVAKKSETIKTMMEDLGIEETADIEEVVPLPNVTAPILKKVTQWAVQHKDDPPPPEEEENKQRGTGDISDWDKEFLQVNNFNINNLKKLITLPVA